MFVYDLLDWPEYPDMQGIKEFFWREFSFDQKFLQSFGLLHVDEEGVVSPGKRNDFDESLRYFIFEEGALFILTGYYPSQGPTPFMERTKMRWMEKPQIDPKERYSSWLEAIEDLPETRPFDWLGEPRSWDKKDWHEKTNVRMQVTQQLTVRDDLACYAYPIGELPQESRAEAKDEICGLIMQFSSQDYSAYFMIEPLSRGYYGSDKYSLIPQDPEWRWSRFPECYREARLREYDHCLMELIPGSQPLYELNLKGAECLMYGIQDNGLFNSICYLTVPQFSTMGINFTEAEHWHAALQFWKTMKTCNSWEDLWQKVAKPDHEKHNVDDDLMRFFNVNFDRTWGKGWDAAEYFFSWIEMILPTCDEIIAEGL